MLIDRTDHEKYRAVHREKLADIKRNSSGSIFSNALRKINETC